MKKKLQKYSTSTVPCKKKKHKTEGGNLSNHRFSKGHGSDTKTFPFSWTRHGFH
jgi:hypothetical protein